MREESRETEVIEKTVNQEDGRTEEISGQAGEEAAEGREETKEAREETSAGQEETKASGEDQEETGESEAVLGEAPEARLPQASVSEETRIPGKEIEKEESDREETLPGPPSLPESRPENIQMPSGEETETEDAGQQESAAETGEGGAGSLTQAAYTAPAPFETGLMGGLIPAAGGVAAGLAAGLLFACLRRRGQKTKDGRGAVWTGKAAEAHIHELGARENQQDAFGIVGKDCKKGIFAAVADGMGGLVNSGEVSELLISALKEAYRPGRREEPARKLQLMMKTAAEAVERFTKERTAKSGSTLVSCLVEGRGLSWLSVGDSRIYLWRAGGLIQLNRDHDFHHDLVLLALQGDLGLKEADEDARRESLTSYIGGGFPKKVEWNEEPVLLNSGDKILLVSDGVYRTLSQEEMAESLALPFQDAAEELKARVLEKNLSYQDNFTAVILEMK